MTLVIHPGALGDVLLAIPALRALRHGRPDASISLAAQPRIGELLQALGVVDEALAFDALKLDELFCSEDVCSGDVCSGDREAGSTAGGLRKERVAPVARFARVVSWFGARDGDFVRRLTALVPGAIVAPSVQAGHPVWQHLVLTAGVPLDAADRWREPVAVPAPLVDAGRRALEGAGWDGESRLVVVHPGAGGPAKRWPAAGFAALIDRLASRARLTVAVHQGPADAEAVAALDARRRGRTIALTEPSLSTLTGMLRCAAAYLGNDSGISQLAAALGVPSVVLFTAGNLEWRPWARHVEPLIVATSALDAADIDRVAGATAGMVG